MPQVFMVPTAHGVVGDTAMIQTRTLPWVVLTLIVLIMGVREAVSGC